MRAVSALIISSEFARLHYRQFGRPGSLRTRGGVSPELAIGICEAEP